MRTFDASTEYALVTFQTMQTNVTLTKPFLTLRQNVVIPHNKIDELGLQRPVVADKASRIQ